MNFQDNDIFEEAMLMPQLVEDNLEFYADLEVYETERVETGPKTALERLEYRFNDLYGIFPTALSRKLRVSTKSNALNSICELKSRLSSLHSQKSPRRFPKEFVEALECSFLHDPFPAEYEKLRLARIGKISLKQVNNWFTNKRNRTKTIFQSIYDVNYEMK